jgi:phosphoglycerate dehydrogenase-like enzyme
MSPAPRLVLVGPATVGYVFASVEAEFRARGVDVIRHTDEASFLADPGAVAEADVLYCMGTLPVGRALLRDAARLRAVVTPFIGTDGFDEAEATARGIVIANGQVPENYLSMAEATIMLMLAALYGLREKEDAFRRDLPRPQRQTARMIKGKMVGLIGFGRMARAIAERLLPWDVRIQAYAPRLHAPFPPHVARVALDALLRSSDIVSIHASLNDETRGLLGAERLALLRPDAILVNTARGGIIDEADLARWAAANPAAKIVLDVFAVEPLPQASPLRRLQNAILTPHLVGHTRETAEAVPKAAIENIARALAGEPPLYVRNPEVLTAWQRRWSSTVP